MKYPGADRHHPADREPLGAKEIDRASQRVPDPHGRREDRAAVLEQKGDARRDRAGQGEGESDDHAGDRPLEIVSPDEESLAAWPASNTHGVTLAGEGARLAALAIDLPLCSVVSMGSLDPLNGSGGAGRG